MKHGLSVELLERELLSIGTIVALWGALEHEIFCQTIACFRSEGQLPKELNNMQFSKVLTLWAAHVVNKARGKRHRVLRDQLKSIAYYKDFRDALVHGMWDWSKSAPEKITATRIRKREVRRTHFTAGDLASFASELETINFKVRYPGGLGEYAMSRQSPHLSRMAVCLLMGTPLADEYLQSFGFKQTKQPAQAV